MKTIKKTTSSTAGVKRGRSGSPDNKKKKNSHAVTPDTKTKKKKRSKDSESTKIKAEDKSNKKRSTNTREKKKATPILPPLYRIDLIDQKACDEVLARFKPNLDLKNLSDDVKLHHLLSLYSPSEVIGRYIHYREKHELDITEDTRKLQRSKAKLLEKMKDTLYEVRTKNQQVRSDDEGHEEK